MARQPNLLFLMADQMQGRVLDPGHPCRTPQFDRLAARGVRFPRAYTPNPVCSPARASLMTGLLPHEHGVVQVTHCVAEGQAELRESPHWAERLAAAGYRTGYFGKWHVERSECPSRFGWQVDGSLHSSRYGERRRELAGGSPPRFLEEVRVQGPEGWPPQRLGGVLDRPAERRGMGVAVSLAEDFLSEALAGAQPWCCFVSVTEPHDPYDTTAAYRDLYPPAAISPAANWDHDLAAAPGLYRKAARVFAGLTLAEKQQLAACYWGSISEIDTQFGRLLAKLEEAGATDETIVVLTSDHGDFLGAHGLYQKNVGAFEEAYQVPLVVAGPGCAAGQVSWARVGLHDLCPTLLHLCGAEPVTTPAARSFAPVLARPTDCADYQQGYAEYFGTRHWWSQRVIWDGPWKLVWNGFDQDELYHLHLDPYELNNLIDVPDLQGRVRALMAQAYRTIAATDDHPLGRLSYASLQLAPFGPGVADDASPAG
ncbi:MAG: sulfatase-like hydrolase/transferase [Armatimonadetes bacterium]|nr:sulfatase-like hydrolase/transferase [Armatimonadota bacterium]